MHQYIKLLHVNTVDAEQFVWYNTVKLRPVSDTQFTKLIVHSQLVVNSV